MQRREYVKLVDAINKEVSLKISAVEDSKNPLQHPLAICNQPLWLLKPLHISVWGKFVLENQKLIS
ncbi:MAG: hypothetical protein F6K48_09315 [Okeania sp. SIO3H1]|uniref:hypothetical protein n=1 Tax=Okeania sp. SIO1I7 TaxID=2607772 RepID=UPI0013CD5D6E|nr:hypothetical protein [Okeania sp. SIO1I7]NEN89090.1 hypothetical protein [Okeania sp. SIO3H1]NET29350.1 hypothetical protein [Okeania sp. SIO1I7]